MKRTAEALTMLNTIRKMLNNEHTQRGLIYCCAVVPGFFSFAWIYTFGFTNYRQHLSYIGLPLGVAMGVLSIGMILLKHWAVIISIALTGLVTTGSIIVFIISRSPYYPAIIIVGSLYIYSSLHYLRTSKALKT
jgi:hypothetical protein